MSCEQRDDHVYSSVAASKGKILEIAIWMYECRWEFKTTPSATANRATHPAGRQSGQTVLSTRNKESESAIHASSIAMPRYTNTTPCGAAAQDQVVRKWCKCNRHSGFRLGVFDKTRSKVGSDQVASDQFSF